jgi:hypothetical protein
MTNRIIDAIQRGITANKETQSHAIRFMEMNGYKLSEAGKRVACNDLEDLIKDVEELKFWQTVIMLLPERTESMEKTA